MGSATESSLARFWNSTWDRIEGSTQTLPAMSNSLGFWDRIQAPTQSALPAMSNSLGFWDFVASGR